MSCDACARAACANEALCADLEQSRQALHDERALTRAMKRDLSAVAARARDEEVRRGRAALEDLKKRLAYEHVRDLRRNEEILEKRLQAQLVRMRNAMQEEMRAMKAAEERKR